MEKIGFVFPGQGSQRVGMGRDLHDSFAEARAVYEEAGETLGWGLKRLSFEGPEEELNLTMRTQPCLLAASVAAERVLRARGVEPAAVAGHSLGEYSALVSAGSLTLRDALRVTELRGRLMQEAVPEGQGLMAAVLGLGREAVEEGCRAVASGYVAPANYNCPGQIVISGERQAVEEAMGMLKERGAKRVIPLAVSVPSHCKLMEGVSKRLSEHLFFDEVRIVDPKVPLVSNADAIFLTSAEGVKAALVKQLSSPVLWEYAIAAMAHSGITTFIELGPGKVLSGLIKRIDSDVRTLNVEDAASLSATLAALGA